MQYSSVLILKFYQFQYKQLPLAGACKSSLCLYKILVFNAQFLVFDTNFLVFDTKFLVFTHCLVDESRLVAPK